MQYIKKILVSLAKSGIQDKLLLSILLIAAFSRLWGIYEHTEFLADQGSAGVVIYEWVTEGKVPLAGPAVSVGQRPGPLYYYLIFFPLVMAGFHPVGPAVFFALLGVLATYIIYILMLRITRWRQAAQVGALLYATSPLVVKMSKTMWNPTAIPLFVVLLLYALWKFDDSRRGVYCMLAGACTGSLIQLHYSNIFTIIAAMFTIVAITYRHKRPYRVHVYSTCMFLIGNFLMLFPFLIYEMQHEFIDIRQLLLRALTPGGSSGKRAMLRAMMEVFVRQGQFVIPWASRVAVAAVLSIVILVAAAGKRFWSWTLVLWFVVGVVFLPMYSPDVYDHYMLYIVPIVFVLIAMAVAQARQSPAAPLVLLVFVVISIQNIVHWDIWKPGVSDIERVENVSMAIIEKADTQPFSFTVFRSRSFSDYHYRYYFSLHGIEPMDIDGREYDMLYLICEQQPCPSREELSGREMDVMCYDHHCHGQYPKLFLSGYDLVDKEDVASASIYSFRRRDDFGL